MCFFFFLSYLFLVVLGLHCYTGFSLVMESGGYSLVLVLGLLLLQSRGSRLPGFRSCGSGLVTLRHVVSSRTRDWTCVPCVGSQILKHWATRKVPTLCFFFSNFIKLSCSVKGIVQVFFFFPKYVTTFFLMVCFTQVQWYNFLMSIKVEQILLFMWLHFNSC